MVNIQPWRWWHPKDMAHFLQLCSEESKALWEEIGSIDLVMLDFLEWEAMMIASTVYLGDTLVLLLWWVLPAQDGGFCQTTSSSMTIALLFNILVSNLGSSGGCWWFFGISRDCAIGTGKDSWVHTLQWTNAKSHCIGQGSHFLGSTWSACHCLGLSHTGTWYQPPPTEKHHWKVNKSSFNVWSFTIIHLLHAMESDKQKYVFL